MPFTHVARLATLFTERITRQGLLQIVAAGFGLSLSRGQSSVASRKRKRRKRKRRRPKPNTFGCLDVGKACAGDSARCCSGICQGTKPKKGKKDRSKCVGHNTGGCLAAEQSCGADVPNTPCGAGGFCLQTTGNAGFCGDVLQGACAACRRDSDCQSAFGDGAACVICAIGRCPETDDRACIVAAA